MKKKLSETIYCHGVRKRIRKLFLFFNLIVLLLIFATFLSSASPYSRIGNFDLKIKNSTVEEIIQNIENTSEFVFIYDSELIQNLGKRSISFRNGNLEELLLKLLEDTDVGYLITDRQVFLYAKDKGNG